MSFTFPNGYNKAFPLIIDPNLVFATYSGAGMSFPTSNPGFGSYIAYSTTYDNAGNTYVAGKAGVPGWPTTTGAYITSVSYAGPCVLSVYTASGNALIYATYFGPSFPNGPRTGPNTLRVGPMGNLVIAGWTTTSNFPVSTNAYQTTNAGNRDLFVMKLSADGSTLLASTYIGGSNNEANQIGFGLSGSYYDVSLNPVEIAFDSSGHVWLTTNSSSTDFPVTANAFQSANAGNIDALVLELDSTLSTLLYSSYLGGSGWDGGIGLEQDANGHFVLVGMTNSANFPGVSGGFHPNALGGEDGFVARINGTTGSLMAASYLGTSAIDDAERIDFDDAGNVYVAGRSLDGNYPVSPGAWSNSDGNIYIQKLSSDLSTGLLSTRLAADDSANAAGDNTIVRGFGVFPCGEVIIGTLMNPSFPQANLALTPNALQDSASPFYVAVISQDFGELLFGSYFGTIPNSTMPGVSRVDQAGRLYESLTIATPQIQTAPNFPTTPNSFSPSSQNYNINNPSFYHADIVTFKINFDPSGQAVIDTLGIPGSRDSGCAPYTLQLNTGSTLPNNSTVTWHPGDGSPLIVGTNFVHTYNNPGVYDVVLHVHNNSACIIDDYDTFQVTVLDISQPIIAATQDTVICNGEQSIDLHVSILNPSSNNQIQWSPASAIISGGTSPTVTVNPLMSTVFYVSVSDTIAGFCGFTTMDTVHISSFPRSLNILTPDTTVCAGTQIQVLAESTAGYTFNWSPSIGLNNTNVLNPIITANQSQIYTLTAHHSGCVDTAQLLAITVEQYPIVTLTDNFDICQWEEATLSANVNPYRNDYHFQWTPTTDLSDSQQPNAHFMADSSGWYYLEVQTPVGCAGTDSVYVTVFPGNFGAYPTDTAYCPPNKAQLWASGGVNYKWTPAEGLSNDSIANPLASPISSGEYTVYIQDIHGCMDTGNVFVAVYPSAVITLPDSITVYTGEAYHLYPSSNCIYFDWFPTNGINDTQVSDPVFNPVVRTRYFVTAKTPNGCVVKDSIDVLVKGSIIDLPNAFTPGNGSNGIFKIMKRGMIQLIDFSVYNRWGNKIFSTNNINKGWDGTLNGKAQPMGVYVYSVEAITKNGKHIRLQGNVTLIR